MDNFVNPWAAQAARGIQGLLQSPSQSQQTADALNVLREEELRRELAQKEEYNAALNTVLAQQQQNGQFSQFNPMLATARDSTQLTDALKVAATMGGNAGNLDSVMVGLYGRGAGDTFQAMAQEQANLASRQQGQLDLGRQLGLPEASGLAIAQSAGGDAGDYKDLVQLADMQRNPSVYTARMNNTVAREKMAIDQAAAQQEAAALQQLQADYAQYAEAGMNIGALDPAAQGRMMADNPTLAKPQGAAADKPQTESQQKATRYAASLGRSMNTIASLTGFDQSKGVSTTQSYMKTPAAQRDYLAIQMMPAEPGAIQSFVESRVLTEEGKRYWGAAFDAADVLARLRSGAALRDVEMKTYTFMLVPKPGDSDAVIQDKMLRMQLTAEGAAVASRGNPKEAEIYVALAGALNTEDLEDVLNRMHALYGDNPPRSMQTLFTNVKVSIENGSFAGLEG